MLCHGNGVRDLVLMLDSTLIPHVLIWSPGKHKPVLGPSLPWARVPSRMLSMHRGTTPIPGTRQTPAKISFSLGILN